MKPFSLLAALGTAAHHGFERQAGVGLVFEPFLGRRRTTAMWLVALPFWMWRATRSAPRDEPLLALNAGVAIAGSAVHFVEWPWSLRGGVLPWLDAAEGLPPSKLPAYNTILWLWMVGGVGQRAAGDAPRRIANGSPWGLRRRRRCWPRRATTSDGRASRREREPERWSPASAVMSRWPDGRRAAVSLTFDNLGEAAEIELGLRGADEPRGGHWSVVCALPVVLEELAGVELPATFFVEGINAEIYPGGAARDRRRGPRGRVPCLVP